MKICSACKWYKPFGAESTDQCVHFLAEYDIGGIRTEFEVAHYTCEVMLKNGCLCEDHKLFEAAL